MDETERLKRIAVYKNVIESPSGREMMKDLYRHFGRRLSFEPGEPDTTAFNEGQRSVYLRFEQISGMDLTALEREAEKQIAEERSQINAD